MINEFFTTAKECGIALLPLIVTFLLFQIFAIKMPFKQLLRILVGVLISYFGLVLLIFGLEFGYLPIGRKLGLVISSLSYKWIILPIGFIFGFVITRIEPSVQILTNDIEHESNGAINKQILTLVLSLGVGLSIALAMLKILLDISLWFFLVPGYILAVILSLISSERFTAIAFDSGGVTTGVMTTTFLLSMALGLAEGISGTNSAVNGFGLIAIVAMTPILMVLLLGKIYDKKLKKGANKNANK